jgi:hypothetical protein
MTVAQQRRMHELRLTTATAACVMRSNGSGRGEVAFDDALWEEFRWSA